MGWQLSSLLADCRELPELRLSITLKSLPNEHPSNERQLEYQGLYRLQPQNQSPKTPLTLYLRVPWTGRPRWSLVYHQHIKSAYLDASSSVSLANTQQTNSPHV